MGEYLRLLLIIIMIIMVFKIYIFNNGVKIFVVGFGIFVNEGVKGEIYRVVIKVFEVGYWYFDCVWFYFNEDEVGDVI